MPRVWRERVREWPAFQAGVWYLLRVVSVEKSVDRPGVCVEFEFVDCDQAARIHAMVLLLPVRPAGLAADFFRAAGIDVIAGGTITPNAAVGKTVRAQFAKVASDGAEQVVRFAPAEDLPPTAAPQFASPPANSQDGVARRLKRRPAETA
jgi:hypothetical protein